MIFFRNLISDRKEIHEEREQVIEILGKCIEGILKGKDLENPEAIRYGELLQSPMERHAQVVLGRFPYIFKF